ncbi:hypothetical protein DFH05DRAFT_1525029 [Lentinula detonsa]|uniref:Uncharacterized protein n=1 Tax=Lentinula detonsa TaxID=2804962 RepID=A0A9W8NZU1_9AGAR|nr:hypothetical protein DFH05DRAFT_1525029 [Lentinula detonsa]
MNIHDSSGFVIKNSQFNYIGGHQITVHRYGSISNEMDEGESMTELITDGVHSIPRLAQVEVPLVDNEAGITIYGHDTLFHARLRPVFCQGGWTLGGLGEDASRVIVRRLAKESSDEDVHQEIRQSLSYYYPYVMQLFGASKIGSPNKFLIYSNPNVTTYINFKGTRLGEDYRSYDAQYDESFNSAWRYLKNQVPVDGFTLDVIFSETRTVNANGGSALIVVPALPSSPVDRAKLITKVLEEFRYKIKRRLEVAKLPKFTRCLECLPSTSGWNSGLINSVLRCLNNVEPHLEWGQFLVQSRIGQGQYAEGPSDEDHVQDYDQAGRNKEEFDFEFEKADKLIKLLRETTESELNKAMNEVILRSNLASDGICSWCAKKWDRKQLSPTMEDSSAFITIVEEEDTPIGSQREGLSSAGRHLAELVYGGGYLMRLVKILLSK